MRHLVAGVIVLGLFTAGCGNDDDASSATDAVTVAGGVTVFAAASLTDAFTELGDAFTREGR